MQPHPAELPCTGFRRIAMGLALTVLTLGGCALRPPDAAPAPDPADPYQLNEAAAGRAAAGDVDTAWLLLERATVLAPHDLRLAGNLAALREYRKSMQRGRIIVSLEAAAPSAAVAPGERASLAAPPPLWTPRR